MDRARLLTPRKMRAANRTASVLQRVLYLLLVFPSQVDCSTAPRVFQPPRASFQEGSLAVLTCKVQEGKVMDYNVLWFQTKPGLPPANVLKHGLDGSVYRLPGLTERLQATRRPDDNSHLLQIKGVQTDDSAIYWCMVESGNFSNAAYGEGTRLSVFGGQTVLQPSVILLTSDKDPSAPILYILCVVSHFYPGVLEVTWKINGSVTTSKATVVPVLDGDGSYSLISLLELPNHIWKHSLSITCEVRHDSSHSVISKPLQECSEV